MKTPISAKAMLTLVLFAAMRATAAPSNEHLSAVEGSKPDSAVESQQQISSRSIAWQKDNYPLATCVVLGTKLGEQGDPVDFDYNGRLIRFCCQNCVATFEKDPSTYLSKLDAAGKSQITRYRIGPKNETTSAPRVLRLKGNADQYMNSSYHEYFMRQNAEVDRRRRINAGMKPGNSVHVAPQNPSARGTGGMSGMDHSQH